MTLPSLRPVPVQPARLRSVLRSSVGPAPSLDARLAAGAVLGWLAVLAGLAAGPVVSALIGLLCFVLGAAAVWWLRRSDQTPWRRSSQGRLPPVVAGIAVAGFCVALVCAPLTARLSRVGGSPVAVLARAGASVTATLRVSGDPHALVSHGVSGQERVVVDAELLSISVPGGTRPSTTAVDGDVIVFGAAQGWTGVLPGQVVEIDASLQRPLDDRLLVAALVAESDPRLLGNPPWWQRAAGVVRSRFQQACVGLPDGVRGLLPGLVDGDTSALDPILAEHFKTAGLSHLVAVSGANCSILIGFVVVLLRRLRCGPKLTFALAVVVLVGFVVIARPSPSVLRAAVMAAIALAGTAFGRQRSAMGALGGTVLLLLALTPQLATDIGFAMSVAATAGLLVIAPGIAVRLERRGVPRSVAEVIAVGCAAHLVTAPLVAALSGSISVVAIPANVLAEPVVAAATILGFLAAATAPFSLGVAATGAQLAGWPTRWLVLVGNYFGQLTGATLPWPAGVGGAVLLVAVFLLAWLALRRGVSRRMFVLGVIVVVIMHVPVRSIVSGWPADGTVMVACDVGQGDGLVLPTAPHRAIVVDSGPEPLAINRCLHDLQITHVSLLVFSHLHLDHVGGIDGVFHGRSVEKVVTGPLDLPAGGLLDVQRTLAAHHLALGRTSVGETFTDGGVRLDVLGPALSYRGTRSDPNNSSVILRVTTHGERILLMGDAEVEAQQDMVAAGIDVRADVLKVPHHGSAYSDPDLLAAVHARVAIVSVGAHNVYGLPSPTLITELARLRLPVERTDQSGDIAVTVVNGQLGTVERGVRASS